MVQAVLDDTYSPQLSGFFLSCDTEEATATSYRAILRRLEDVAFVKLSRSATIVYSPQPLVVFADEPSLTNCSVVWHVFDPMKAAFHTFRSRASAVAWLGLQMSKGAVRYRAFWPDARDCDELPTYAHGFSLPPYHP